MLIVAFDKFREGREDVINDDHPGHSSASSTSTSDRHVEQVLHLIDRLWTIAESLS